MITQSSQLLLIALQKPYASVCDEALTSRLIEKNLFTELVSIELVCEEKIFHIAKNCRGRMHLNDETTQSYRFTYQQKTPTS